MMATISTFHTTSIILADNSKFSFVGSIAEAMFSDVPVASKILEAYKKFTASGFRSITPKMQAILAEEDKPKKGGQKGGKKSEKKQIDQEGLSAPTKPPTKRKVKVASSTAAPKRREQPASKCMFPTPSESESSDSET